LHDRIISIREEVWAHKTGLTLLLLIEVPVLSQESERPFIGVLGVSSNRKTKNTTLSEQFQNLIEKQKIPQCRNSSKI
jgi:hypothetical protein